MNLLERVYAQVPGPPEFVCKGLCQRACGPIGVSAIEADALAASGIELPTVDKELTCSHLREGRCAIYANRPLVCRLFGAVKKLPCPHGCKPAGGYLSDVKARELLEALEDGRPYHMSELKINQAASDEMDRYMESEHEKLRKRVVLPPPRASVATPGAADVDIR